MTQAQEVVSIDPTLVFERDRLATMANVFGSHATIFEANAFNVLGRLAGAQYTGGYWNFYRLSNGGFYMAPRADKSFRLTNADNHYEGSVTPDAAGIIASLFALNRLCARTQIEEHIELYYHLREYIYQHPERREILKAID